MQQHQPRQKGARSAPLVPCFRVSITALTIFTVTGVVSVRPLVADSTADSSHRPNIVFVLADDLGSRRPRLLRQHIL